jgi:hypothetical protein
MHLDAIIQSIDEEIDRLQRVRALLTGHTAPLKRGFPPPERWTKCSGDAQREGKSMSSR